ncbi:phage portal protein [Lachnospira intestinalis]|uniref:Phage portal protein n=1 Tax=Lachnospira intestinalis TaxID=3133158 RepID=A0ABV1H5B6_9FIRM
MGIKNFFHDIMTGKIEEIVAKKVEMDSQNYVDSEKYAALVAEEFMINVAINMIANAISKCEFKTFFQGQEKMGDEYYLWNYQPNVNQSSSEFLHELVYRLLYEDRVLVVEVGGQLIIADGFSEGTEIVKERTFYNISRGSFSLGTSRTMSQVMYFKLNNNSIRRLLKSVCDGYNQLMDTAIEKFEKSGGEKGILSIDAQKLSGELKQVGKTFDEVMEDMMNNRFKKFYKSKNAVLPLFNGYSYESKGGTESTKKSTSELNDVINIDDKIVMKVANSVNMPVALLKGDVSDVERITQNFLTFCIDPICSMLEGEINRKRSGKAILQGTGVKIDTTSILHIDLFSIAEKIDKLISSGMYSIDELRKRCGDTELGTEASRRHYITKNYEKMEGSEESAQFKNDVQV